MKIFSVWVAGMLLFLQATAQAADLSAAATDVCQCLEAPYKKVSEALQRLSEAQASGNMADQATAQGEMMAVMGAAERCFNALPAKYPEIDKSKALQDKVMKMVDQQCPNPAFAR
ncbi:MAG TPA: hypothetical protein DCZ12_15160 [Gammaproteobacteria bacterium]|nr:hypothetical protein [Gammaproteobacteria bacterium]HCO59995.1 hypothetical protein [Porticoccaceae bacterium]